VFQLVQLVHLIPAFQLCWTSWDRWRAGKLDKGGQWTSFYPRRGCPSSPRSGQAGKDCWYRKEQLSYPFPPVHQRWIRWIRGKAKLLHTLCVKAGNVGTGLGLYRTGVPALHLMPAKLILAFHQRWTAYPFPPFHLRWTRWIRGM
jgi:hypothetical protein